MKKLYLLLIGLLLIPTIVLAEGISVGPTSISVKPGASASFTVSATNAAGKITITSSDPSVAKVSTSSFWIENNSVRVTVTGVKEGTATIKVVVDAATFSEKVIKTTTNVSVKVATPAPKIDPNKSGNSKLKSITMDGYTLKKVSNKVYEATVGHSVESVKIKAVAADSKAKVSAINGSKLQLGLNNITFTITAENGTKTTYTVKVTRKDSLLLSDIKSFINEEENPEIVVDKAIEKADLEIIKESNKTVILNVINDKKEVLYSYLVDGKTIKNTDDITSIISFDGDNKTIEEKTNYAYGLSFNLNKDISSDIKLLFNNTLFTTEDKLYVYNVDTLEKYEATIIDGKICASVNKAGTYLITKSILINKEENDNNLLFPVLCIIEGIVILGMGIPMIIKSRNAS